METMKTGGGVVDTAWRVEAHGIQPVPEASRHGGALELFKLWVGANTNYVVIVTGAFVLSFGLSFWSAVTAILIGNALGCVVVGLASIMGPKTGTAGIVTSRTSFGQLGSFMPKVLSVITALSWFSINAILATDAIITLFGLVGFTGPAALWSGLGLVVVSEVAIAIYGHATIIWLESYISVLLAVVFAFFAYFVITHISPTEMAAHAVVPFSFVKWLGAMSLAFSFPVGWSNYASDYSRYFPKSIGWKRIAVSAGLGQFLAITPCEILGVLVAILVGGHVSEDPMTQLAHIFPVWFFVPFLLAIILGGVAANVPNGYTAGLGLLALRLPMSRTSSLLIIAVFTIVIRAIVLVEGNFIGAYETFLAYMSYWIAPWAAIVVTDYFMRGGRYDAAEMMRWRPSAYWYDKGLFWPGIVAFLAGVATCLAFSNSSTFASPLMTGMLHMGDFSFEAGIIVAVPLYWLLAKRMVAKQAAMTPQWRRG